jgi:hypothetical protein
MLTRSELFVLLNVATSDQVAERATSLATLLEGGFVIIDDACNVIVTAAGAALLPPSLPTASA